MKKLNQMRLEIPARSVNEGFARAAVGAFAAQLDPTLEQINDIKTAVSEAVTNAIVHAYPDEVGKIIVTAAIYENGRLDVHIKDFGIGIDDISRALEPLYTTGGDDRAGMGFTIMGSFMSALRVISKPGKGTTVKMSKTVAVRSGGRGR